MQILWLPFGSSMLLPPFFVPPLTAAPYSSAALMLIHLGYDGPARRLDDAVDVVLRRGDILTPDLGGKSTTEQVVNAVLGEL